MKNIIFNYLFVIAIVSITLLSACSDEGNAVDTTLIYPYKMTLTLDGDGFTNKTVTLQKHYLLIHLLMMKLLDSFMM